MACACGKITSQVFCQNCNRMLLVRHKKINEAVATAHIQGKVCKCGYKEFMATQQQ